MSPKSVELYVQFREPGSACFQHMHLFSNSHFFEQFVALHLSFRWVVEAEMDPITCTAIVNFKVPGRLNRLLPDDLLATIWTRSRSVDAGTHKRYVIEFTDPKGMLTPSSVPVNAWVQVDSSSTKYDSGLTSCIDGSPLVFKDIQYDNKKQVTLSGNKLTILPYDAPFGKDDRLCTSQPTISYCQFFPTRFALFR